MVSFKNSIIIMTSNLGSADILEAGDNREAMRALVMNAVGAGGFLHKAAGGPATCLCFLPSGRAVMGRPCAH